MGKCAVFVWKTLALKRNARLEGQRRSATVRVVKESGLVLQRWHHVAAPAGAALVFAACAAPLDRDPIYLALKARPPTQVPADRQVDLRKGHATCDVFNEGQLIKQYMLCGWPGGRTQGLDAILEPLGSWFLVSHHGGCAARPSASDVALADAPAKVGPSVGPVQVRRADDGGPSGRRPPPVGPEETNPR